MRKSSFCLPLAALAVSISMLVPAPARAQAILAGERIPFQAATPEPYPGGAADGPSWSATIAHPGATFISVHFDRFQLAPGDRVVVRSVDGGQRHAFTGRGRGGRGQFWASHVKGDTAIVELFSPARRTGPWVVSIDQYSAGILDVGATEAGESTESVCTPDDRKNAICYQVSEPEVYQKSRAVARLLIEGTLLCTGWLVGCDGHFMTNNHCIDDSRLPSWPDLDAVVANVDYEFMSEAPTCGSPNGQLQHPGVIWGGAATLIGRDVVLDYALIQLAGNPEATYGSFLLETRSPVVDERFYMPQHPGGRAKELGVESTHSDDQSGFCEITSLFAPSCIGGGPPEVGYRCDTEGGSSGSPIVSYDSHQVIGLHHCGICTSTLNRALDIVDVIGDLGAALPVCALAGTPDIAYQSHVVDDVEFGNDNGRADPFEILTLPVTLENVDTGGASNVSGTITTTVPGVTILDDTATWADMPAGFPRESDPPHFQVQLSDTIPCGTVITFNLNLTTDQGPFFTTFDQTVGLGGVASGSWSSTDTPLAIPDNFAGGAQSGFQVPDSLVIGDVQVSVDITHPRIGDLIVELTSPGSTTVRLHDRSGGQGDDIVTTYDSLTAPDGPGTMDDFNGENVNGGWILTVSDNQGQQTGTLNSWSIQATEDSTPVCSPVPCEVTAQASATPQTVCGGDSLTLADAGSTEYGQDCSGVFEYRFEIGGQVLQDWSTDPDAVVVPPQSTEYTVRVRDQGSLAEDTAQVPVTVQADPTTTVVQAPDPMCQELNAVDLDAGAGFATYEWRDDAAQVVGASQVLSLSTLACGREYTVEVESAAGCTATFSHTVACEMCGPAEVSGPGAPVMFQMNVDALGSVEFELIPNPTASYHLYAADSIASMLAGDYQHKFCDLENSPWGTWIPVDSVTVRFTPVAPTLFPAGMWVVVAEDGGFEGSYGSFSSGAPRPQDTDGAGSVGNFGCP